MSTKPNSHDPEPANPLDGVVTNQTFAGPILQMQTGLFELGRKRAIEAGATEPQEEDIQTLEEHAAAMAQQTHRQGYDPKTHPHDAKRETEYQECLAARKEEVKGEAHALANQRAAELKAAQTPVAGPKPTVELWVTVAFVVAITVTVAPTIHDLFHTISDDLLVWFVALLSSVFVAAMVTFGILNGRRTKWGWISVAAGIILGLGLFLVRIGSANGAGEILLAAGLTIAEVSAVLLLEALARSLTHREDVWMGRYEAENEATSSLKAAQTDVARRQARIKELNTEIGDHIIYVENRHLSNIGILELQSVAKKAVRDGYFHGIAENVHRVRGVRAQ